MSSVRIGEQADGLRQGSTAAAIARGLRTLSRRRGSVLGENLFGDPAWDILLDLFVSRYEGRRLSVSAVCIGAGGSAATALRYLALLEARGLALRSRDASDGRRSFIDLTPAAIVKLEELLVGSQAG